MRIVTRPALPAVRILCDVEIGQGFSHVVASKTLRRPGHQSPARRVLGCKSRHLSGKAVTACAVPHSLSAHLCNADVRFLRRVTSGLTAGLLRRLEVMQLPAVTFHALDVLERCRVGLEMNTMPCGGRNACPRRGVLRHMTRFAARVGNYGVRSDFFRALGYPHIHLPRAGEHRLLVARVTRELRMLRLSTSHFLIRRIHHVAAAAEFIRVLRVIPRNGACRCRTCEYDDSNNRYRRFDRTRTGSKPPCDAMPPSEKHPQHGTAHYRRDNQSADLYPAWNRREKKSHNLRNATGQWRFDPHGIERGGMLKRRGREISRGAVDLGPDHNFGRGRIKFPKPNVICALSSGTLRLSDDRSQSGRWPERPAIHRNSSRS